MQPRLTAGFWVAAYLARLRLEGIPAFVTAHGDETAGAVIVKLNTLDGRAQAFQRSYDAEGKRVWVTLVDGDETPGRVLHFVGGRHGAERSANRSPSAASTSAVAQPA